jgi:hypothetical protein
VTQAGLFAGRYPLRKRHSHNIQSHFSDAPARGIVQVQANTMHIEANTYFEAINSLKSKKWIAAMHDELQFFEDFGDLGLNAGITRLG